MSQRPSHLIAFAALLVAAVALAFSLQAGRSSAAQAPEGQPDAATAIQPTFNYQGILRLADGSLANGQFDITIGLYAAPAGGEALGPPTLFEDTQVTDGIFNVVLENLPANAFADTPRYIGVTVAPDTQEMLPRQRVHPVPWALQATQANTLAAGGEVPGVLSVGRDEAGSGSKVISFARGGGDDVNAGKLAYKASWDPNALSVVGAGVSPSRLVRLFDDLTVNDDLVVQDSAQVGGALTVGGVLSTAGLRQVGNASPQLYQSSLQRYVVEARHGGSTTRDSANLREDVMTDLCADFDGCSIWLGLRNWESSPRGILAMTGPHRLSLGQITNGRRVWRVDVYGHEDQTREGTDGDGANAHLLDDIWGCYLNDHTHANGNAGDASVGLSLWDNYGGNDRPNRTCVLIVED